MNSSVFSIHENQKILSTRMLLTAFLAFSIFITCAMIPETVHAKKNYKYASIIMDADTGLILHQRYANKKLYPASLTKVMTLLMTFDAIEQGRIKLSDRIKISRHAASMVPSKLDLPVGSSIRVKDAIYILITKSANDIAVALAEHLGGSETNFARMMTKRANDFGMTRTTFKNASGLHNPYQVSTARDMAKMARTVINKYPKYYRYFSKKNFTYNGKTYRNHNHLMNSYKGMDGMKTGYVQASGFNLVASAVRNNHRVIGVVFGGRTSKSRNAHMAVLLDRGFAKLNKVRMANAKIPLPSHKPGLFLALNSLSKITPASGSSKNSNTQKWAFINPALESGIFGKIIGEGDYDPEISQRFETGLMAIAAHKGKNSTKGKSLTLSRRDSSSFPWAIQVGAYKSRAATDRAIQQTLDKLPTKYAHANPVIAPLKTQNGWLFRGRLNGYTKQEAFAVCSHLTECLPVAPNN